MNDVKEWFRTYYGPSNVVLVLAGDIDLRLRKKKCKKYYATFRRGASESSIGVDCEDERDAPQTVQDRVPQARIYKIWNMPQYGSAEADYLDL